jgi:hypothetical protein
MPTTVDPSRFAGLPLLTGRTAPDDYTVSIAGPPKGLDASPTYDDVCTA